MRKYKSALDDSFTGTSFIVTNHYNGGYDPNLISGAKLATHDSIQFGQCYDLARQLVIHV